MKKKKKDIYQKKRIAQTALEYAVLIAAIVGALVAMQAYLKRSIQAKYKESGDVFGGGVLHKK